MLQMMDDQLFHQMAVYHLLQEDQLVVMVVAEHHKVFQLWSLNGANFWRIEGEEIHFLQEKAEVSNFLVHDNEAIVAGVN